MVRVKLKGKGSNGWGSAGVLAWTVGDMYQDDSVPN